MDSHIEETFHPPLKEGSKLIAVDPCAMSDSGEEALVVGKMYSTEYVSKDLYEGFSITSELGGTPHYFDFEDIEEFPSNLREKAFFRLATKEEIEGVK